MFARSLALALALVAAPALAKAPAMPEPPADGGPAYPPGAPRDDYGLVSWCYGALRGYLDLHDEVMPEVTRIESAYRRPGSNLQDDLKVYADMERDGKRTLKVLAGAMEAAEKASLRPINTFGAEAVRRGRSTWAAAPNMSKSRVAQEWMSWALPARCETTARRLTQTAKLSGAALQINAEPLTTEPAPAPEAGTPEAPAPEATAPAPEQPLAPLPPGDPALSEFTAPEAGATRP